MPSIGGRTAAAPGIGTRTAETSQPQTSSRLLGSPRLATCNECPARRPTGLAHDVAGRRWLSTPTGWPASVFSAVT
jgi:hypothetical protein